jgi:integrase/recombinase XerD
MPNPQFPPPGELKLSQAAEQFLEHARIDLSFSAQTIDRYAYCIKRAVRCFGDLPVSRFSEAEIRKLKSEMIGSGHSVNWQIVMLAALKRVAQFCREQLKLPVLDPALIIIPTRPWRKVVFLTVEEIDRFVRAIPLRTQKNEIHHPGLRFRALVEVLLGTAMRIGEVLSLNRADIDFERKEARVIGKGNKERVVFFTDRSLFWLRQYLETRSDDEPALFANQRGSGRLHRTDIWRPFTRYRQLAGLNKPVRPHLLRHTAATQLLFNGCPVGHIKEILGHERLETTCRYYLGLDQRAAKLAHQQYLVYDS